MAENRTELQDQLFAFLVPIWKTLTETHTGQIGGAVLGFDNSEIKRPDESQLFGRLVVRHTPVGGRVTLGDTGNGAAVFRNTAQVTFQVFLPQSKAMNQLNLVCSGLKEAMENAGRVDNIRLRDPTALELGPDGAYYQVNVTALLTYDRVA